MPAALQPFRYRNFALLWTAALLSNVGSWMQTVAVGILVTARTGRAGWTGLVAAAAFLPNGLMSPIGGLMADRFERRWWLFATTVGEVGFAAGLTVWSAVGRPSPAGVTALVFGGGIMAAAGFPAYQAMLPELVEPADLGAAISLSSAQYNLGRVVGPALAGVVIVAGGYAWAFAVNTLSFLAVLSALALLRLAPSGPPGPLESIRRRLTDGLRATSTIPPARFAVLSISVVALTASPFIALIPAVALRVFHAGPSGTAVLVTAQGIGAVSGALALTPLANRFGRRPVFLADVVAVCTALALYAACPDIWAAAAAVVVLGAGYIGVLAGLNTVIQLHAPPALRGRMLGIYMMALGLLYPVGASLQGALADRIGLRWVTAGGGAILLAVAAVAVTFGTVPAALDPDRPDPSPADPEGDTVAPSGAVAEPPEIPAAPMPVGGE